MKAYVISKPGGPEVLELKEIPDPVPEQGQVLIEIKAFGLNRAEAITRMGGSFDAVKFPKVIGIECVGIVADCPDGTLLPGQKVAAAMGGMGRKYNGSYAEKIVVPLSNVFPVNTSLTWEEFGAVPETYFTAWGCLFEELKLEDKPRVVVRPAASALGIAITQMVNLLGGQVIGITRSESKKERMLDCGMYKVIVSDNTVAAQVKEIWPEGADGVVDAVVSETSLADDFDMLSPEGRICLAGSLAASYGTSASADFKKALEHEQVSFYSSEELHADKDTLNLQYMLEQIEARNYKLHTHSVISFDALVEAHKKMDNNEYTGKVVVKVEA